MAPDQMLVFLHVLFRNTIRASATAIVRPVDVIGVLMYCEILEGYHLSRSRSRVRAKSCSIVFCSKLRCRECHKRSLEQVEVDGILAMVRCKQLVGMVKKQCPMVGSLYLGSRRSCLDGQHRVVVGLCRCIQRGRWWIGDKICWRLEHTGSGDRGSNGSRSRFAQATIFPISLQGLEGSFRNAQAHLYVQ